MIGRLWPIAALGASMAMGQATTAPKVAASVKALTFEVVSIRQNVSEVSLQAFLADRCKMAVHRQFKELAVYSLLVDKGGPKFKPTNPPSLD